MGHRTTGKELLDLNFMVSSMRNMEEEEVEARFARAFYEDRRLAVKWMFYAGDVRGGLGERRLFRICLRYLAKAHPKTARAVLKLAPEYTRWDNLLVLLDTELAGDVISLIDRQIQADRAGMEAVKQGEARLHGGVLFPYDIVHKYYQKSGNAWYRTLGRRMRLWKLCGRSCRITFRETAGLSVWLTAPEACASG